MDSVRWVVSPLPLPGLNAPPPDGARASCSASRRGTRFRAESFPDSRKYLVALVDGRAVNDLDTIIGRRCLATLIPVNGHVYEQGRLVDRRNQSHLSTPAKCRARQKVARVIGISEMSLAVRPGIKVSYAALMPIDMDEVPGERLDPAAWQALSLG
jgi:hypothetical protein